MGFSASNSAPPTASFPSGVATGGWADSVTITSAGLAGQAGTLVFTVDVDGFLEATGFSGAANFTVIEYVNKQMVYRDAIFDAANGNVGVSTDRQMKVWGVATYAEGETASLNVADTVTFTVPFVFGQSFELGIFGKLSAGMRSAGGITTISTAGGDFLNTITWGGVQSVLSGGTPVTFTIGSASGANWAASVPEPGTALPLVAGLGALALRRRR